MFAMLVRMVALVALLFMPFGMQAASANVAAAAAAMEGHCDGHQQVPDGPAPADKSVHCAACAGLPATLAHSPTNAARPMAPALRLGVPQLRGILPEIATPPPKSA